MARTIDVRGITWHDRSGFLSAYDKTITVRYTEDEDGRTLSLADEKLGVMLQVPFEPVEGLIAAEGSE